MKTNVFLNNWSYQYPIYILQYADELVYNRYFFNYIGHLFNYISYFFNYINDFN
jgi:hypothetical protein